MIGSIIGSLIDRNTAKYNADKQFESNKIANQTNIDLAQKAQDYDYQKWQEMNKYNDPASQMGRLKAAGLNPNLIYGSGNVTGNVSGGQALAKKPEVKSEFEPMRWQANIGNLGQMMGLYSALQTAKKDNAQTDLINQNIAYTRMKQLTETQRTTGMQLSNQQKRGLLTTQSSLLQSQLNAQIWKEGQEELRYSDMDLQNKMNKDLKSRNLTSGDNAFFRFLLSLDPPSLKDIQKTTNKWFPPIEKR